MRKCQIALISALLFSLTGCANSRLRKDFVAMFKSDWPAQQSPFARKCDRAGQKLADGVNQVGSKFDDGPVQERSGKAVDAAKSSLDKTEDKAKSCLDWTKEKIKGR